MKKMINTTHIEGYVYEHKLELKVTGEKSKHPGTEYITGDLMIATDDACLNIVPVHFSYVTAMTAQNKSNATFSVLKSIIDKNINTVMEQGKDRAGKVRIDSAVGLNDFYTDRNGTEELVSAKRNEGGFVHSVDVLSDDEKKRSYFECDMLITGVSHVEPNEERNLPEKVIVKGATFDFRNALLPVEFSAVQPNAMAYFESLGASNSNPIFTKVWGTQVSETIIRKIEEESAFGDVKVREVRSSHKDWVLTGALKVPYVWDDESTLTAAELTEAISNRETYLATVKQRSDEYKASKAGGATGAAAPSTGAFNF